MTWITALSRLKASGQSGVLVTILGSAGSAPHKAGSKMLVTEENSYDTVGGGHLEYLLIEKARKMLSDSLQELSLEHFPLGPKLGQCCGGSVSVLLEPISGPNFTIALFGAGHIGKALINVLVPLDCQILWIDNRPELFPQEVPENVRVVISEEPEQEVADLPEGVYTLVVTHNHQLDYAITEASLVTNNSRWLGVIGSQTKARRFRQRLAHRQAFSATQIEHMCCPVGLEQVGGRKPEEIAIAIAAEVLSVKNGGRDSVSKKREGVPWQALKGLLKEGDNVVA